MKNNVSAGILLYRVQDAAVEVLLVHPGGPYFKNKDKGSWTIPKGLVDFGEEPIAAAVRELFEETGLSPEGPLHYLGEVRQKGGKLVHAWSAKTDLLGDLELRSNTFELEWPPHSGKTQTFPEIDQMRFFTCEEAKEYINPAQVDFIQRISSIS